MNTNIFAAAVLAALPVASPVLAADAPAIEIHDAFARSSNQKTGAAFMMIGNTGDTACTLSAVSTPAAEKAEFHTNIQHDNGMMQMVPIEGGIEIPAGEEHALARGGDHVMMMGLTGPMENGDEITLSLDFGDCGTVETVVPVDNDRTVPGMEDHAGSH
ncbi:copper chaperone PCu(A)C [Paracoccus aerodenitrificans]|uniref:copper chaperone PCu(A)C n=1 Tax=Paracoccus aerodenitrificans TaxID=3017781 RepID=UPI0022F050FF|nr:copper chaperone PCu(A)C [Paracoccus aerodenitrificans]WBU63242.1 copper chaperone PCu(A)C [Paracoccus aerodenitrificans]